MKSRSLRSPNARKTAVLPERISNVACPYCGTTLRNGGKFRYLEDIVCYRRVTGTHNGRLSVEGLYQSGEGYDCGSNARLECRYCLAEFPIPDWVEIDWT
jgi:hypothetical protein